MNDNWDEFPEEPGEWTFATGRLPDRTYASRSFPINRPSSRDFGKPARFVYKVFDPETESMVQREGEEWVVRETPAGRFQIKLLMAREAGNVKEIWIHRVPTNSFGAVRTLLNLKGDDAARLVDLVRALEHIPIEGQETTRVDDTLVRMVFEDPGALRQFYDSRPEQVRDLIINDETARDVIAVARRRSELARFKQLLEDDDYFALELQSAPGGPESVWQRFFEENPWVLGISLAGQLLTSWDESKLEQAVTGRSIGGVGKRVDGLMRTAGRVRSMVFVEFKTHKSNLLQADQYRAGCWAPSTDLAGGVAQAQGTVHRAVKDIGERILGTADDGTELPDDVTYLLQPRSHLVIGRLDEFKGEHGGDHVDKVRSFELYRRNLMSPEVITYDELYARAEWLAEASSDEFDDSDDVNADADDLL
jgi:hypothetical protein